MNSSHTKNPRPQNWRRVAVTLVLSVIVSFSLLPVVAQLRAQKRITSVWTATTAEGSRVHVVSDEPVNDYEGYTRGGRFYVKIPLADLPSARGSLLGRGFDDVQIQRYGDGIIISFHLLPGTIAHVEQASNRLEVVFTIPAGSRSGVAGARDTDDANRTRARRTTDAAGPSPSSSYSPSSVAASVRGSRSQRRVPRAVSTGRKPANRASASRAFGTKGEGTKTGQRDRSTGTSETATSTQPNGRKPTPSPTPVPSMSPAVSSAASPAVSPTATTSDLSASASTVGTPVSQATPAPSEPSAAATPNNAANSKDNDWGSRVHYWRVWAELNWVPLLVGGLIGLTLLVLLFFWRGAKRARDYAEETFAEPTAAASEATVARQTAPPMRASEAAAAAGTTTNATGAGLSHTAGQTHSSNAAPSEPDKPEGEEPEREVFEL